MAAYRLTLAVAVIVLATPAAAIENTSAYTKLDLAECRQEPPNPDDPLQSGVWWCEGYDGMKVLVLEGDLRFFVSYGDDAAKEPAASQTLPSFNNIGGTLEWRLERGEDGEWHAFATILRFLTDSDGVKGETLVVTKIGGAGQVCHVGMLDAKANPNANELARGVADDVAPEFVCGAERAHDYGLGPEGEGGD